MITKYINEIWKDPKECYNDPYTFLGDGDGDFEDISSYATKECVEKYIEYCEFQINLAREVLKNEF